jgi:hypothetical protein
LEYARDIWHIGQFEKSSRAVKAPARVAATVPKPLVEAAPADALPETEEKQVAD